MSALRALLYNPLKRPLEEIEEEGRRRKCLKSDPVPSPAEDQAAKDNVFVTAEKSRREAFRAKIKEPGHKLLAAANTSEQKTLPSSAARKPAKERMGSLSTKQPSSEPSQQNVLQPKAAEKPSQQEKTLHSNATAEPARKEKTGLFRTKLTQVQARLKATDKAYQILEFELDLLRGETQKVAKQQGVAMKKAVGEIITEDVVEAVKKQCQTVEVKMTKALQEDQKAAAKEMDKKLDEMRAEMKREFQNTANELQELRDELKESEKRRQESEKHASDLAQTKQTAIANDIAQVKKEADEAIAKVKEEANEAINSAKKVTDQKLQQAREKTEAAEPALTKMQKDIVRRGELLGQQQARLEFEARQSHDSRMKHKHARRQLKINLSARRRANPKAPEPMEVDSLPQFYPSPQSDVAQQTPQSQNSAEGFASSTSTVSTHDQGWKFSSSNANPFANSTPSKVIDTENIAMQNHSREGLSSDAPHNDEFEEASPVSNDQISEPPYDYSRRLFNGTAQSNPRRASRNTPAHINNFQRPVNGFNGADRANSRRASRNTPGHINPNFQQPVDGFNGAGHANSRRAPRNTPGPSQLQIEYSQQPANDFGGANQSYFGHAAPPSRTPNGPAQWRQSLPGNNNLPNFVEPPRPAHNTRSRSRNQRHAHFSDEAQQQDFGYTASQSHNSGSFAQGVPTYFDGPAPPAPRNGPVQTYSPYQSQKVDFFAQSRAAADLQRAAAANNNLHLDPAHGQPQYGQRGGANGGRGRGGGGRGGRGVLTGGRGRARAEAREDPHDGDDERDGRTVMANNLPTPQRNAARTPARGRNPAANRGRPSAQPFVDLSANNPPANAARTPARTPARPRNPFASQGGPSHQSSLAASLAAIARGG